MLIRSAKSDLKCVMKLGNGAIAAHQDAAPDLKTDFSDPNPQLIDLHRLLCAAHAPSSFAVLAFTEYIGTGS